MRTAAAAHVMLRFRFNHQSPRLATGSTVWAATDRGTRLDGDDRSLLVSEFADKGTLSLLDLETGKKKWSVPDPGFDPYPSQRTTFLVGDRALITE
ncbi:hypothetical protein QX204_01905 [Nocardia sp. PE-7]|uniref:hypothetical protein n=1 Tax=Nocardia sp. PE-7 TaxID=3058426 RepID=UPI002659097A|nr:hypothetical protein [Nocardia sp. PE-7]WKG10278.1 hypothetical protein QX204_01905 [Nocardia sp. PE-7]